MTVFSLVPATIATGLNFHLSLSPCFYPFILYVSLLSARASLCLVKKTATLIIIYNLLAMLHAVVFIILGSVFISHLLIVTIKSCAYVNTKLLVKIC